MLDVTRWEWLRTARASPALRSIGALISGNLLSAVIGVVGSLVQARFLLPEDLGYFRQFAIITGYASFLQAGMPGMVQLCYPLYIGQGRRDKALAVVGICQAWCAGLMVIAGVVFIVLAVSAFVCGNWRAGLAWLVQIVVAAGSFYGSYLGATYRSGHDFIATAKASIISQSTSLLALPFFAFFPYVAVALRSSLGATVGLIYLHVRRPVRLQLRFSWSEWARLVRIGLPMFVATYGSMTGWSMVENTLVLKLLDTRSLGLWSMSVLLTEIIYRVPQAVTAVYTPRLTEEYGRTESVHACLRLCRRPLLLGVAAMVILAGACCATIPFLVRCMMPKYVGAIDAMCLMMLYLPMGILDMPYAILVAVNDSIRRQLMTTYIALGVFVPLAFAAVHLGLGIAGIVIAGLLSRSLRLVLIYSFLLRIRPADHGRHSHL